MPPSIGELNGLKRLDLQSNKVDIFPEGTVVVLCHNYFNILMILLDICRLHLTQLDVSDNLIQQLPTSIRKMSMLVELQVDGNPLSQPPPQVKVCLRNISVHILSVDFVYSCRAYVSVMLYIVKWNFINNVFVMGDCLHPSCF